LIQDVGPVCIGKFQKRKRFFKGREVLADAAYKPGSIGLFKLSQLGPNSENDFDAGYDESQSGRR